MTDKEFHNGTEAIPWSERGGLAFPRVAARRRCRRIRSDDRSFFSASRPLPQRAGAGHALP